MPEKRFNVRQRAASNVMYSGQLAVFDSLRMMWTPAWVAPKIAQQLADRLGSNEISIQDVDWQPNDGNWDVDYVGPNTTKFEIMG